MPTFGLTTEAIPLPAPVRGFTKAASTQVDSGRMAFSGTLNKLANHLSGVSPISLTASRFAEHPESYGKLRAGFASSPGHRSGEGELPDQPHASIIPGRSKTPGPFRVPRETKRAPASCRAAPRGPGEEGAIWVPLTGLCGVCGGSAIEEGK